MEAAAPQGGPAEAATRPIKYKLHYETTFKDRARIQMQDFVGSEAFVKLLRCDSVNIRAERTRPGGTPNHPASAEPHSASRDYIGHKEDE